MNESFLFSFLEVAFESQFPPVFDEELLWEQQKNFDTTKGSNQP